MTLISRESSGDRRPKLMELVFNKALNTSEQHKKTQLPKLYVECQGLVGTFGHLL